ncbi:MAG: ABC transporter ATP-binding protein [Planctomycetales bacterium]|nr:ABC transporter ATP-binding protein [Planctomycetales bacterium]
MTTGGPAVEARDLGKTYRVGWRRSPVEALTGVSLSLGRGEVLGILGPNGSGKTTLLKLLLGFVRPTAGSAETLGLPAGSAAARARIGFLPEEPGLPGGLTPREALDLHGRLLGHAREARRRATSESLARLGAAPLADRPCRTLSRGQARRVALARALLGAPDLLLLDEPTAALDPLFERDLATLLAERRSAGAAVLLCSHLHGEVERLCDRLAVLWGGRLLRVGPAAELLADPNGLLVRARRLPAGAAEEVAAALRARGAEEPSVRSAPRAIADLLDEILREQGRERGTAP